MWKEEVLENLLLIPIRNGLTKPSKIRGKGVKMIGMGELFSNDRISTDLMMDLVPATEKEIESSSVIEDDLLFARQSLVLEGAGKCSIVTAVKETTVFESHLIRLRINKQLANPRFLYYYFRSPQGKNNIRSIVEQVAAAGIRGKDLVQLKVPCPDIEIQNKVADLLDNIDRKIENNEALVINSYKQIEAICRAWLHDYIPFGNQRPEDWDNIPLSSIADFIGGYSYKGQELVETSSIAMAGIKNFDRNGGFKISGYKPIEPSSKLKPSQYVELFDILVAHTDLTQNADVVGNAEVVLSKGEYDAVVFSMDVVKVVPKTKAIPHFLIVALLQGKQFKTHCLGYVNGTTVLHLSKKALQEYEVALPKDISILNPMIEAVQALYEQMSITINETNNLQKLRDALIPEIIEQNINLEDLPTR